LTSSESKCKTYVVGALYGDTNQLMYSFSKKEEWIELNPQLVDFFRRNKAVIENLNYYKWARFYESINDEALATQLMKLINDDAIRKNESVYRGVLAYEFERIESMNEYKHQINTMEFLFVAEEHSSSSTEVINTDISNVDVKTELFGNFDAMRIYLAEPIQLITKLKRQRGIFLEQKNKSRILYLLKLLNEYTDEHNPLSTVEIINCLKSFGISAHRKTVASDIALLEEFGIDVITIKSTQNKYYIGNRDFELPEIKLLVDEVESSKFITSKKSEVLVSKLALFVRQGQANELKRHIYIDKRIKPEYEEIYYTVDCIHAAINTGKQVEFKYIEYNQDKERIYKNNGYTYKLSPYALAWSEDHYYVIGYIKKHGKISKFRVDRMAKVNISENNSIPVPEGFSAAQYAKNIFEMYDGEMKTVELKCTNDLMKVIIDRFGENVNSISLDSVCFKAIVEVSISPTFYGWVFGFAGKMTILSPEEVKNEYIEMAMSVAK
jgi:predicted DNA-binding transcriptional regulator YafY